MPEGGGSRAASSSSRASRLCLAPYPDCEGPRGPHPVCWGSRRNTVLVTHGPWRNAPLSWEGGWPAPTWRGLWGRGRGRCRGWPCRADPARRPPPQQERLKAQEHRAEMEEKVSKRSLEAAGKAGLAASGPGLLPRKPPGLATGPAGTYGKTVSPPPSPRASPVAALKAKVIQKLEDASKPPGYAYPATPSSHPSSPPPASPPPTPGLTRKEEAPENVVEKKDLELEKEAPSPFQALFPGRSRAPEFLSPLTLAWPPGEWVPCALPHPFVPSFLRSLFLCTRPPAACGPNVRTHGRP